MIYYEVTTTVSSNWAEVRAIGNKLMQEKFNHIYVTPCNKIIKTLFDKRLTDCDGYEIKVLTDEERLKKAVGIIKEKHVDAVPFIIWKQIETTELMKQRI